jgi:ferrous iron transport protein B
LIDTACHPDDSSFTSGELSGCDFVFALTGNANVGKSVIFNQLTGMEQVIGNWPGKTVERAMGTLSHHGQKIAIIDLPGIYSLSTYSLEELITRDYIALEKPPVIINVVDSTSLERNLFLTLQLLEMEVPVVIALNQADIARKKGIEIDTKKLEELIGCPVIPTVAIKGEGLHEVIDKAMNMADRPGKRKRANIKYGKDVEARIDKLTKVLDKLSLNYPSRWLAIKLLEDDEKIVKLVRKSDARLVKESRAMSEELKKIHGDLSSIVISAERYAVANAIADDVQSKSKPTKPPLSEKLDTVTMHSVYGYLMMFIVLLGILIFISIIGDRISVAIEELFESFHYNYTGFWPDLIWNGGVIGFYAAASVALGFILPFYLLLGAIEDSGYIPRVAFLMDSPFHKIGLHGKACMPLLLGFGCSVPACAGCRIMDTPRERFIAAFLATLVPCSARTVVILGLVGAFIGIQYAVILYVIDFVLIIVLGWALNKRVEGAHVGLIMEVPKFRTPSLKIVLKQSWVRLREFVYLAFPLIVIGSLIIEAMYLTGTLDKVSNALSPVTVVWLGLPSFTGILLIFGFLRKEAALVLLATVAGTTNFAEVMTPEQMFVFALVIMIYVPCIATISILIKDLGWKYATYITLAEIALAVALGGVVMRIITIF